MTKSYSRSFEIVSVQFTLPVAVISAIRVLKLVEAITVIISSCLKCNGGKAFVILHWCDKCKMTPVDAETRLVCTFIVHLIVQVIQVKTIVW